MSEEGKEGEGRTKEGEGQPLPSNKPGPPKEGRGGREGMIAAKRGLHDGLGTGDPLARQREKTPTECVRRARCRPKSRAAFFLRRIRSGPI